MSQNLSAAWINPHLVESSEQIPKIAYDYLPKILTSQVYEAAIETPLTFAASMSASLQNEIYLKREDTQPVFSFKIRGAYNKIAKLSPEILSKGVVTCSAGNHAQGVALSAAKLKINATIVMPLATPSIKVNAVRRFGGPTVIVKLHGKNYDEASDEANRLCKEQGLALIHPFDDPDVIAGQGTIGMEILKNMNGKALDAIFACVGGGGLLSGISAYVKALRPGVKVIGVEADDAAGMTASLLARGVVTLPSVGLFADGAAVRTVGKETFSVCSQLVDEMITVTTDEICAAIKLGFNDTRCVLEPAGALAIAGMVKYIKMNKTSNQKYVAISSGANMDFDRLRFVSERADSSETLMAIQIPEKPGSFKMMQSLLHPRNITEFSYRHDGSDVASVIVSFQALAGHTLEEDKRIITNLLEAKDCKVTDMSQNEMAKSHVRHLAGGRGPKLFTNTYSNHNSSNNLNCMNDNGNGNDSTLNVGSNGHSNSNGHIKGSSDNANGSKTVKRNREEGSEEGELVVVGGVVLSTDDNDTTTKTTVKQQQQQPLNKKQSSQNHPPQRERSMSNASILSTEEYIHADKQHQQDNIFSTNLHHYTEQNNAMKRSSSGSTNQNSVSNNTNIHGNNHNNNDNNNNNSNADLSTKHTEHQSHQQQLQPSSEQEVIYRFEFPEHAGALDRFLSTLDKYNQHQWTISLFHYRNHGHDFGRVLVGMIVQYQERAEFNEFLNKLGYSYYHETDNTAYTQFLQ